MTTPIPGLNQCNRKAPRKFSFDRFQWVLDGTLARSGQPGYTGGADADHTIKPFDLGFLRGNRIVCVISANRRNMDAEGMRLLSGAGIYFHHADIEDFKPPTPAQVRTVADTIEHYRTRSKNPGATLIYCGFGEGRTGAYVAGWAMLKYMANLPDPEKKKMCSFRFLRNQFGVERADQAQMIKAVVTGRRFSEVSLGSMPDNAFLFNFGGPSGPGNAPLPSFGGFSGPGNVPLPSFGSNGGGSFKGPKPGFSGFDSDMF